MNVLVLDNKLSLNVQALTITPEKIWSKNTGRVADGEMKGDIVAIKQKLEVTLNPMSDEKTAAFDAIISQSYFDATFRSPRTGKLETHKVYAGSPAYPVYSYVDGLPRYVGVKISLIMR